MLSGLLVGLVIDQCLFGLFGGRKGWRRGIAPGVFFFFPTQNLGFSRGKSDFLFWKKQEFIFFLYLTVLLSSFERRKCIRKCINAPPPLPSGPSNKK